MKTSSLEHFIQMPAYGISGKEKHQLLGSLLKDCLQHHSAHCPEYRSFLNALTQDSFAQDALKQDALAQDAFAQDAPIQDTLKQDALTQDSFAQDALIQEMAQDTDPKADAGAEEDIPFLPVSVFKEMDLKSIPDEEVFKVITSSGTSGQLPSRIYLDGTTSTLQQKVLARIVAEEIGDRRLPCLILDTKAVLRDRQHFSARGAGILGFSMFASRTCYALDENMQLNLEEIRAFIGTHRQKALEKGQTPKFLLYGFTFMIWQYFVRALEEQDATLNLEGSVLIHGGGWKKLQSQAVSPEEFAARIRAVTGIETVRSYYGMAEQTGCICMECACGHLHASTWSDVIVRREKDYGVCAVGEPGILQVLTPITMSYPGHSLLTEDRGLLLGEDDCACGRKGKYFRVLGRLPKAETRGCSDTFEAPSRKTGTEEYKDGGNGKSPLSETEPPYRAQKILPEEADLIAGVREPVREGWAPFAPKTIDFLDAFSRALRQDSRVRRDPETMALAFWCRRAHISSLQEKHGQGGPGSPGRGRSDICPDPESPRKGLSLGRGRIFHLAPANVPMMFAYTWVIGLLAGNAGIVRVSERTLRREAVQAVLDVLKDLFSQEAWHTIRQRTSFVTYAHDDAVTEKILQHCDGRVLWGGDETIRRMRRIPMPAHAVETAFPDRVSLAVIDEGALEKMEEGDLRSLVHRFYNDTYVMDQNGCSSPQTVVWLRNGNVSAADTAANAASRPEAVNESENVSAADAASRSDAVPGKDNVSAADAASRSDAVPGKENVFGADTASNSIDSSGPGAASERSVREKWWELLAEEAASSYENDGFRAARKLEKAALSAMRPQSRVVSIRRYCGNTLYVLRLSSLPEDLSACRGGFGLFYEAETDSAEELFRSFGPRIQTVVCIGIEPDRMAEQAVKYRSEGVLRFVAPGQALQIDTVWDGIDLIGALSRRIG